MTKLLNSTYIFLVVSVLTACGNAGTKDTTGTDTATAATHSLEQTHTEHAIVAGKFPDPVCGMPYDTMYKETSVYQNDTLYFCSPTCKRVFDKNPEKYAGKLGL